MYFDELKTHDSQGVEDDFRKSINATARVISLLEWCSSPCLKNCSFMHSLLFITLISAFLIIGLIGFIRPASHQVLARGNASGWVVAGLFIMILVVSNGVITSPHIRFGFAEALAFTVGLAMALLPMVAHERNVVSFFTPFWSMMASITLLMVWVRPSRHLLDLSSLPSEMHFILSMLAHAFFTLWALLSFLHLLQMSRLHRPGDVAKLRQLPPLMAIERQALWMGRLTAIFLTSALMTGFFYAEESRGSVLHLNHKLLFSGLAWLAVLGIVWAQWWKGWRGKRMNIAVLMAYGFLLLSYIGSQFVREILLSR